jgi:hypothetical protein
MSAGGGWQTPRKRISPQAIPTDFTIETYNAYESLSSEEDTSDEETTPDRGGSSHPDKERDSTRGYREGTRVHQEKKSETSQRKRKRGKVIETIASIEEQRMLASQEAKRPFKPSYYLPGKLEGKPALFLVDTGCNTNLMSRKMFDTLPERVRRQLLESDSHGLMADGTQLPFYGLLTVTGKLRDVVFEETFVVSQISEDAILGMPFLTTQQCRMDFSKPVLTMNGRELMCTDRLGRMMTSRVQSVKKITVLPGTESAIPCRVTSHNFPPLGMVEGLAEALPLANSVNRPDQQGRLLVRCLNPTSEPIQIPAGSTVGTYTVVEDSDIQGISCSTDINLGRIN